MPHTIRLRGAWDCTTSGDHVRHTRKFGRPRTLDAGEQVWLVCDAVPAGCEVIVNGQCVGTGNPGVPFAADITAVLETRNEVAFQTNSPDLLGEVALEIRSSG